MYLAEQTHQKYTYIILILSFAAVIILHLFYESLNQVYYPNHLLHYFISVMYFLCLLFSFANYKMLRNTCDLDLIAAFSLLLLGEITVILYNAETDLALFVAHSYRAVAFGFIFKAFYFTEIRHMFIFKSKTAKALEETQVILESFFYNAPDSILIMDLDGKILRANPGFEKMYGYNVSDVIGKSFHELINVDKDSLANFKKVAKGKSISNFETVRTVKDGSQIYVSIMMAPVKNHFGKISCVSAITRDITEQKNAEKLLQKSEKLAVVGELAAGVAHEIRNPLTTLKGFTQLLQSGDYEGNNEMLHIMSLELDKLDAITNEFMVVAKPQAVKYQENNMKTLMNQVILFVNPQAILSNVVISCQSNTEQHLLYCDGNQIKQVFINVMKNSIEAMTSGGTLTIEIEEETSDSYYVIRIKDTGCGIPDHIIPKLGEPFYTLKEKGTGLGLMVSFRIIEAHHGKINFMSEKNKGTTVEIRLPLKPHLPNTQ